MPEKSQPKTNRKNYIDTTEIPRSAKIWLNLKRQKMVLTRSDLTWNTENLSSCIKLFLPFFQKTNLQLIQSNLFISSK